MLSVPLVKMNGESAGEMQVDPAVFGGRVRPRLLKQAIVAHRDHQRRDSARTKRRSDVEGSTRKLYRQKGTGNARAGMIRTPVRRGGGRTFARRVPRSVTLFPKKMRRLARASAILAKIQSRDVLVLEDLACAAPKTKVFSSMVRALGVERGCVLAMHEPDRNVYLSGRNVANADVCVVGDLSAYDVLRRRTLIFTRAAFEGLLTGAAPSGA